MDHPLDSTFESFVIGAMAEAERSAFVAHVSECEACAKKLASEAQAELGMYEVHAAAKAASTTPTKSAKQGNVVRLAGRRRSAIMAAAGALALAAAILLLVLSRRNHEEALPATMTVSTAKASEPIPLTVCPDGSDQEKCIEDAHRHGRFVSYPPWASTPPLGGGRSGQGPSASPFPVQM